MRDLKDVYESARLSIPLRQFPTRAGVPAWEALDDSVHEELARLNSKVLSVCHDDTQVLESLRRVIGEFNRGVRSGFLDDPARGAAATQTGPGREAPFRAGVEVGQRTRGLARPDMALVRQFITATHLLGYEFGQLADAVREPFDFLVQNVSPERADELGDLAFALPVLINHKRDVVEHILHHPDFSFDGYYAEVGPAPDHAQYLTMGVVAMFDPHPMSWRRVGASLGLSTTSFAPGIPGAGGQGAVPEGVARAAFQRPIAAHEIVRRQMERIGLARGWTGVLESAFELDEDDHEDATLWDVWQMTDMSHIRSDEHYLGDMLADTITRTASAHLEETLPRDATRLAHLRRHFPAFVRGFDARYEGVVDPRALRSAGLGRALSDGLRRFEGGGLLIGTVSRGLAQLGETIAIVHHASETPTSHVLDRLRNAGSSPVAEGLLELFESRPALLRDLFDGGGNFTFNAGTDLLVAAPYDLLRGALFCVLRSVRQSGLTEDARERLLADAREQLFRVGAASAPRPVDSPSRSYPGTGAGTRAAREDPREPALLEAAMLFSTNFDALVRLLTQLWTPLYMARLLTRKRAAYEREYA